MERDSAPKVNPFGYHRTTLDEAVRVLTLILEGMSIRSISRAISMHQQTIASLLLTAGAKAATVFDERVRNLKSRRIQCDEMWPTATPSGGRFDRIPRF